MKIEKILQGIKKVSRKVAGEYKIEFNGSDVSSGVYFLRMKAGDYTSTKKMMLMR